MSGMQTVLMWANGQVQQVLLPPPDEEVLPGVSWGRFDCAATPAFWKVHAHLDLVQHSDSKSRSDFRLGATFREEVVACLLGGYGIPAEVGVAAFRMLREGGLLATVAPTAERLYDALQLPLSLDDGRRVHYRFARQKSQYLAELLAGMQLEDTCDIEDALTDLALREWLLGFRGIGWKTASWIVRNWRGSHQVAIIDVHVLRAGVAIGLFPRDATPTHQYRLLEARYLAFAEALQVHPAHLDTLIWKHMRTLYGHHRQRHVDGIPCLPYSPLSM